MEVRPKTGLTHVIRCLALKTYFLSVAAVLTLICSLSSGWHLRVNALNEAETAEARAERLTFDAREYSDDPISKLQLRDAKQEREAAVAFRRSAQAVTVGWMGGGLVGSILLGALAVRCRKPGRLD